MDDFDFISALNSFNEKYLPKILIFLLVFVVGSLIVKLLLKLIRKIIDKSKIERTVITFFLFYIKNSFIFDCCYDSALYNRS